MILDHFAELNWLAVVVATLAWFVFSAIWYSLPPISEGWQRAAKVDASEGASVVTLAIPTLIGYFVATIAFAMLVSGIGATTFDEGLALGIVLGLAFGAVGALVTQLYEQKGAWYWVINGVNLIIAFAIVGVILAVWN